MDSETPEENAEKIVTALDQTIDDLLGSDELAELIEEEEEEEEESGHIDLTSNFDDLFS